jgi:hypothetical protein
MSDQARGPDRVTHPENLSILVDPRHSKCRLRKDLDVWPGPKILPYAVRMKLLALSCVLLVTGCGHPVQRFVPVSPEHPELALDTKTGQMCLAMGQGQSLPKCGDLYRSGE